jgi:AcrR family transcriptional regulator
MYGEFSRSHAKNPVYGQGFSGLGWPTMPATPWGDSSQLRERKLRAARGAPRAEVEQNQRERLHGAVVAVVASKGYGETTISDLIEVAGLSRSTFYGFYEDKEACFLATLDLLVRGIIVATEYGLKQEGPVLERAEAGLGGFVTLLVEQPDAARICVVESEAAGPRAVAIVDRAVQRFGDMLASVLEGLPGHEGMPRELVDALVGGLRKLMQTRLNRRTEGELAELAPHLVALGLSYTAPPGPLPDRAPRGKNRPSVERQQGVDEPSQRLELAAMAVIAREGYADSTMESIAREAGVSLKTIYALFDNKADLLDAALLRSRLRMITSTIPAYKRAGDWPSGMVALVRASLAFLEAEADFTRLITVDVHGAGAGALETRDRTFDSTQPFIEAGFDAEAPLHPIAAEAIQGAIYELVSRRVRSRHKNLVGMAPLAIYMILAPFLGAEEAYRRAVA